MILESCSEDGDSNSLSPTQLNDLADKIRKHDFKIVVSDASFLAIRSEKGMNGFGFRNAIIMPAGESNRLSEQLLAGAKPLSDHFGYFSNDGYFELVVRIGMGGRRGVFDPHAWRAISKLASVCDPCKHDSSKFNPIDIVKYHSILPRLRSPVSNPESLSDVVLHVSDPNSGVCIELSPQSPCGAMFGLPNGSPEGNWDLGWSIKIVLPTGDDPPRMVSRAHKLANSFMYEMAVRNGVYCEPINRADYDRGVRRGPRKKLISEVRFPVTDVGPEVSELYSFAEAALGNPPLAFLSFYQVLEYFFPQAERRAAIRNVKRELSDPTFLMELDSDIMKVIRVAEKVGRSTESQQIATLVESSVRIDHLRELFSEASDKEYFGRKGPISGVGAIDFGGQPEKIAAQVSDRVYKLRNRIVHAKDDPKYADSKVLLPRSREAAMLRPDVELARFLAQEVIIDTQV